MSAFYKAVFNGNYHGKDNQNILWYQALIDPAGGAFGVGGAVELSHQLVQEVVPAYLAVKPSEYILETIDIYPHNNQMQPIYQLPYKLNVQQPGMLTFAGTASDGPALCVNVRFNLEPTVIGPQSLTAPKRGYVAIGPIPSNWIDNEGKLDNSLFNGEDTRLQSLATALSENVESLVPPALFAPIRVSMKWGVGDTAGGLISWGWAGIQGATIDQYVSFRRSRRIRG